MDPELPEPAVPPTREQVSQSFRTSGMLSPYKEDSISYNLGKNTMQFLQGPSAFSHLFDHGALPGGAAGALGGAGLGYAGSKLYNMFASHEVDPARVSMVTGLLGALMGGTRGHFQGNTEAGGIEKPASASPMSILDAANIPSDMRMQVLAGLTQLDPYSMTQLVQLLRTATGAGAGIILMRFLAGKGLLSSLVGGLAGGFFGSHSTPKTITNVNDLWS